MRLVKQYQLYLENRPGSLERLTRHFAEQGLNILAMMGYSESGGGGSLRLSLDDPEKATALFATMNARVKESDVLMVEVPNRVGAALEIIQKLNRAGISVDGVYCTTPFASEAQTALLLSVPNPEEALAVLKRG